MRAVSNAMETEMKIDEITTVFQNAYRPTCHSCDAKQCSKT